MAGSAHHVFVIETCTFKRVAGYSNTQMVKIKSFNKQMSNPKTGDALRVITVVEKSDSRFLIETSGGGIFF